MKMMIFAGRTVKEISRDYVNIGFGLGFPIILLLLLTAIQSNIPVDVFKLNQLTPGVAVFGLSFLSLFSAVLISKDRTTSFLSRLFTAPMTSGDFIMGYMLPLIPMAVIQCLVTYLTAFVLGLDITASVVYSVILIIPTSLVFISIGLLCGSIFNDRQVGGICGALLTNLTAWLSGTWFDLDLVGGSFKTVAYLLPFAHAVDMGKAALNGDYMGIFPHIWWVLGYGIVLSLLASLVFKHKMNAD